VINNNKKEKYMKTLIMAAIVAASFSAQAKAGLIDLNVTKASEIPVVLEGPQTVKAFILNHGEEIIFASCAGTFLHPTNRTLKIILPDGSRSSSVMKNSVACARALAVMSEATAENPATVQLVWIRLRVKFCRSPLENN
jgi:hypothetical protein